MDGQESENWQNFIQGILLKVYCQKAGNREMGCLLFIWFEAISADFADGYVYRQSYNFYGFLIKK